MIHPSYTDPSAPQDCYGHVELSPDDHISPTEDDFRILRRRCVIAVIVLALIALLFAATGCVSHETTKPTTIADVTPDETSLGAITDLRNELALTKLDLRTTLDAKKELDQDRARIEQELKQAQSTITIQEADAKSGREIKEAAAKFTRTLAMGLGSLGGLAIIGGIIGFFFIDRRLATASFVLGVILVPFAAALPAATELVTQIMVIAAASLAAIGVIGVACMAAMKLWMFWQTNKQSKGKRKLAAVTRNPAERATLIAEANILDHVGSVDQNAKMLTPGTQGVAMVQAAIDAGAAP